MMNRVRVEILGSTYHIATEETEEYVNQLVQEINGAADSLRQNNPQLSINDVLALVALASTDSFHKSEQAADNLRRQLTEYLEEASRARMELTDLRRQLDNAKRERERINRHAEINEKLGGNRT